MTRPKTLDKLKPQYITQVFPRNKSISPIPYKDSENELLRDCIKKDMQTLSDICKKLEDKGRWDGNGLSSEHVKTAIRIGKKEHISKAALFLHLNQSNYNLDKPYKK